MYVPGPFRIGSFEVTSFGAMVAVAALVGLWMFGRELRKSGIPADASDAGLYGFIGGFVGAKLLYVVEHFGEEPVAELLLARGGLSWHGGFGGGLLTGILVIVRRGLPLVPVLAAATPALAVGHLIGRIGCFLVGHDYGRPSNLPWAIAFPEGLPPTTERVHPTQLYEAAFLGVLAPLLVRWRRRNVPDHLVLARYLAGVGAARFVIEFVRINERVGCHSPTSVTMLAPNAVYVTSEYSIKGKTKERDIDGVGLETLVVIRDGAGWKIRHSHTSSRRRAPAQQ